MVFSAALTEEERNNIAVYEKVADGVVNITGTAVQMDFFFNVFPTQGSGSGSIIDSKRPYFNQPSCRSECPEAGGYSGR